MVGTFLVHCSYPVQLVREYGQEESQLSVGLTGLLGQRRQRRSRRCHRRHCSHWYSVLFVRDH